MYLVPTSGTISRQGAIVELNSSAREVWEFMQTLKSFSKEDVIIWFQEKHGENAHIKADIEEFWDFLISNELIGTQAIHRLCVPGRMK